MQEKYVYMCVCAKFKRIAAISSFRSIEIEKKKNHTHTVIHAAVTIKIFTSFLFQLLFTLDHTLTHTI